MFRPALYLTLIRGSVASGNRDLGLLMLSEMQRQGFIVGTRAYEYLLQMVSQPQDLNAYLMVS